MNEEQCKSRLWTQFSSASSSFFSSFSFFSLISLNFFQYMKVEPLPSAPSRLFIGNEGTWLICSSPRRAVASTWSNLARPGELVTSPLSYLGVQASQRLTWASQGSEKGLKWSFCPPFWVFSTFLIKTLNDNLFRTVTGIQHCKSTSKDQKINKR